MNRVIPFDKNELNIVDSVPGRLGRPDTPIRNTPVSSRENISALYFDKHPYWCPIPADSGMIAMPLYNAKLGRGGPDGLTDAFGIKWVYESTAGGSIVVGGNPILKDANEWQDIIKFPNIDEWDWAAEAEANKVDMKRSMQVTLINGFWFERLISFMDFMPAAMALIDDDQKEAIKSLFAASTEFAKKVVDKFCEYWPGIDGINVHDDWSAQKAPFFSMETAYELFVPFMKELTDHIHSKGRYATLHSCGHGAERIQCFIDGGFDSWDPQLMNDTHMLYEKYGDKIILAVVPEYYDPETTLEDEQRRRARDFVDRFCNPGRPCTLGGSNTGIYTPAFSDELYEYSRKKYGG